MQGTVWYVFCEFEIWCLFYFCNCCGVLELHHHRLYQNGSKLYFLKCGWNNSYPIIMVLSLILCPFWILEVWISIYINELKYPKFSLWLGVYLVPCHCHNQCRLPVRLQWNFNENTTSQIFLGYNVAKLSLVTPQKLYILCIAVDCQHTTAQTLWCGMTTCYLYLSMITAYINDCYFILSNLLSVLSVFMVHVHTHECL